MIPLAVPNLCGNEAKYLQECITTGFVSSVGAFVDRFEAICAEAAGTSRAVATSSGTTGLHLALTTVGVSQGDLVILPSFTFIASANAIAHCGATPWLFDVQGDSWNLDPSQVRTALEEKCERQAAGLMHRETGRRVAAMMPVYALGLPADMEPLANLAAEYGLPLVADAACAIGSQYRGKRLGELADLSVFSFNGNKTVTCGGGGALVGSSDQLMDLAKHLSTTARVGNDYHHDRVGFNYRMTNLQAAIGCAQMEQLDEFVAAKRKIHARYVATLTGSAAPKGVTSFPKPDYAESACWFTGTHLDRSANPTLPCMEEICAALQKNGIAARPFWKPVHLQPAYQDAPVEDVCIADRIWTGILTLPCSTGLTESEQNQVIAAVRQVLHDE